MIKKVTFTFERFKLMRAVIQEAGYVEDHNQHPGLADALKELNRHEAVAVADQYSTGHIRHKEDTHRRLREANDLPVCDWCHGDHIEEICDSP